MSKPRHCDPEYKAQAVKLAQELDSANKAAKELGISKDTIYGWMKASREGRLMTAGLRVTFHSTAVCSM